MGRRVGATFSRVGSMGFEVVMTWRRWSEEMGGGRWMWRLWGFGVVEE